MAKKKRVSKKSSKTSNCNDGKCLPIKGLALKMGIAGGIVWCGFMLIFNIINAISGGTYGKAVLDMISSLYPGFVPGSMMIGSLLLLVIYAFLDGAIFAYLVAWFALKLKIK